MHKPNLSPTDVGRSAEDLALAHLQEHGLSLVERNFHSRFGEIDLIMRDDRTIVLIEVRSRRSKNYGGAAASVDHRKQMKLIRCAEHYIAKRNLDCPMRFDVVAISTHPNGHEIQWITDAFQTN